MYKRQGKRICILGFAFKANTNDTRESSAIKICKDLLEEGAIIYIHDPRVNKSQIEYDLGKKSTLKRENESVLQICRNRWTEGIYNIGIKDISSDLVAVNQGDVADLTEPESFNDLELAWIKSKKELLSVFNDHNLLYSRNP